ncbi:MAG TPA: hypothetical protein VF482_08335 [Trebonia sp.]
MRGAIVAASRTVAAAGVRVAALLLGAACVAWTATPLRHIGWANLALAAAIVSVTAGALRLALAEVPQPEHEYFLAAPVRAWLWFLSALRLPPWEEIAVAALVWLEVLHPARPWHTAALGAGLAGYLLTVHIAESGAPAGRLLHGQAKVLAVGACLLALGAGAAMLPAAGPGAGSSLLRVLAAAAVIAAAALVLPA